MVADGSGQPAGVTFTPVGQQRDLMRAIDDAYRSKYARYGDTYLQPMLADQAVATTLRLTSRTDPVTSTTRKEPS